MREAGTRKKMAKTSYQIASDWIDKMSNTGGRWNWSHVQWSKSLAALLRNYKAGRQR